MYLTQRTNWGHFPGLVCFFRRRENQSTQRKTSRSKDENQQQTRPTYDAETGNRTRATLVGGECSHHYAIPAPSKLGIPLEINSFGTRRSSYFVLLLCPSSFLT